MSHNNAHCGLNCFKLKVLKTNWFFFFFVGHYVNKSSYEKFQTKTEFKSQHVNLLTFLIEVCELCFMFLFYVFFLADVDDKVINILTWFQTNWWSFCKVVNLLQCTTLITITWFSTQTKLQRVISNKFHWCHKSVPQCL